MKTLVATFALTAFGSLALAAVQEGVTKPTPRLITQVQADPERSNQSQASMQYSLGGPSGNCAPAVDSWFSPIPISVSYDCRRMGRQPFGFADVNGDGVEEYMDLEYEPNMGIVVEGQVRPTLTYWILQSKLMATETGSFHTHINVFPATSVPGQEFKLQFPNVRTASVQDLGWRDMDGDGDLDLVVNINFTLYGVGDNEVRPYWFENIGYEKPTPPLAADLNEDGNVDGVDLGMLLASWGAQS